MIEDGAVDGLRGARQAASCAAVGIARAGVAARVIVSEDDAGAAMLRRVGDDLAEWKGGAGFVARMTRQVHAPCPIVDMSDPQAFASGIRVGETAGKEFAGGDQ